jgi:hypothetical protein
MSEAHTTTNHETIRRWAEERGGHPAAVSATHKAKDPGLLRIDFEGDGPDPGLEEISWDEFFDKFDEAKLAFLYQEKTKEGQASRFFKFVHRDTSQQRH